MKILTGKTFATALIAGLLVLASVENHADELDIYLDDAMRTQVFEELKENMLRQYEGEVIVPADSDKHENLRAKRFGFPVANQGIAASDPHRFGVLN